MPLSSSVVLIGTPAPAFALPSAGGREVALADYRGRRAVALVFLRGFYWRFCRRHLSQLRADYPRFTATGAEVLAIAPHPLADVARYAARTDLPFPLLADPRRAVYRRYDVGRAVWSFGQRPGLYVIDRAGVVQYAVLGAQMWELPANDDVLAVLSSLDGLARAPEPARDPGPTDVATSIATPDAERRLRGEAGEGSLASAPASDWQL